MPEAPTLIAVANGSVALAVNLQSALNKGLPSLYSAVVVVRTETTATKKTEEKTKQNIREIIHSFLSNAAVFLKRMASSN